jgi:glycosyltransferase involved in cell wall biosynthesis
MRIAVFDYQVIATNPVGSCDRKVIEALCEEHDFTVFAVDFENPNPARVRWIRVWAPRRPLALLFVAFHILAPLAWLWHRAKTRRRYDVVQKVESNLLLGDVIYSQFCHRAYMRDHWPAIRDRSLRGWFRWLDHRLHSIVEPIVYSKSRAVVAPSRGLKEELSREFDAGPKTAVIHNPVQIDYFKRPEDFDKSNERENLGFSSSDTILVFVALGHFERKGLPIVIESLSTLGAKGLRLVVVGGEPGLISKYQKICTDKGVGEAVLFTGHVDDVRPYLWIADAFVFPSSYEAFSLVSLQAAAAGLAMISSRINGVEEFLADGKNGIIVERTKESVASALIRFQKLAPAEREAMGQAAREAVRRFDEPYFVTGWREFYEQLGTLGRQSVKTKGSS